MVPISISTADCTDKPVKTTLLDNRSMTVTVENIKPGAWCKVNVKANLYLGCAKKKICLRGIWDQ